MTSQKDQLAALEIATHYRHANSAEDRPIDGWERGRLMNQVKTGQYEVYDFSDLNGRRLALVRNKTIVSFILPSAGNGIAAIVAGAEEARDRLTSEWTDEAAPDFADFDGSDWWEQIDPERVHKSIRLLREVAQDAARLADRLTDELLTSRHIIAEEP